MHADQRRAVDHAPFVLHPLEVAALLNGRDYDDEIVIAGVLHDIVERTDASVADIERRFGERVASIVGAVTEDASILDLEPRKRALRTQVAAADAEAHAVYAADKVAKMREFRAEAARDPSWHDDSKLQHRLVHYELSLDMLLKVAPQLALVRQLDFELWALSALPPAAAAAN